MYIFIRNFITGDKCKLFRLLLFDFWDDKISGKSMYQINHLLIFTNIFVYSHILFSPTHYTPMSTQCASIGPKTATSTLQKAAFDNDDAMEDY